MSHGTEFDVAIVGGGPAGAAAATRLAEAGRRVLVLERARGRPAKVCGEFVSAEALGVLRSLGLSAEALGAPPIGHARITTRGAAVEHPLPFPAAGLSRDSLDAALLVRAERAGARVRRGTAVREVAAGAGGARLRLSDGSELRAGEVLIATGKQDLAGRRRSTRWAGRNRMLGLKMHLGLEPPARRRLGDTIEMHLFPGGCAGLQPIESGANLCITLSQGAYDAAGRSFETLLRQIGEANPSFRAALSDSWPLRPRPLAVARVPYGFLRAPGDDGLWHVGDQIAVTSSLTGAGLAIALDSGTAAAEALLAGAAPEAYRASFVARARRQIEPAMALQAIVDRPRLHRPSVLAASALPRSLGWLAAVTRLPQAGDGRHPPPSGLGNRPGAGSLAPAAEQGAAR